MRLQLILAGAVLAGGTLTASAASIDKSVAVKASPQQVWDAIGPFCSISTWHPAIGNCTMNGDVRTLTTKDGGKFVEKRTSEDAKDMKYSYAIEKSPLPITDYKSTLQVTKDGSGARVEWSSTYTPDKGKEEAANKALTGIYQSGLDNIQKMFGKM